MRPLIWTTREGVKIPVTEMTDSHLRNTIAMLQRREAEFYKLVGDMDPFDLFEGAMSLPSFSYTIGVMERELAKRPTPQDADVLA